LIEADTAALNERGLAQYDDIDVLPGVQVNGQLTATEHGADLGTLQFSLEALQTVLEERGNREPIDGFAPEQQFVIAYTATFRVAMRDKYLSRLVMIEEDAPV
jgi:predicted metalloendopeptidase